MGRVILNNAITVDAAFEAPAPEPDGWLVNDEESLAESLEMWRSAEAMLLGRKTFEGLATVWPQMTAIRGLESYAEQMNTMPKYVASTTLREPIGWNATLLEGSLTESVSTLKAEAAGDLVVAGLGELARNLIKEGLVDELWFTVSPYLWSQGPRMLSDFDQMRLHLVDTSVYPSGAVRLCYRMADRVEAKR